MYLKQCGVNIQEGSPYKNKLHPWLVWEAGRGLSRLLYSSTCLLPVLAPISAEGFCTGKAQMGEVSGLCIFPLFDICHLEAKFCNKEIYFKELHCVEGALLWCVRGITCTIATGRGFLAKCTRILLSPAICFLCSVLSFMRKKKKTRCFPSLKNVLQFKYFVFVSNIPLLMLLADSHVWGKPSCFQLLSLWHRWDSPSGSCRCVAFCFQPLPGLIRDIFLIAKNF